MTENFNDIATDSTNHKGTRFGDNHLAASLWAPQVKDVPAMRKAIDKVSATDFLALKAQDKLIITNYSAYGSTHVADGEYAEARPDTIANAQPGSMVLAERDSLTYAHGDSSVIAERKSWVRADAGAFVFAKAGSLVHTTGDTMVAAESGATVLADLSKSGESAVIKSQPGANVFMQVNELEYRTNPGRHAEIDGADLELRTPRSSNFPKLISAASNSELVAKNIQAIAEPGSKVIAQNGAIVLAAGGSDVTASGNAVVIAEPGAHVTASGDAKVFDGKRGLPASFDHNLELTKKGEVIYRITSGDITVPDGVHANVSGARVTAQAGSRVDVCGRSYVVAESGSHVRGYYVNKIVAQSGSDVTDEGSAIVAKSGSSVEAGKLSVVKAEAGSQVHAKQDSVVYADRGAKVKYDEGRVERFSDVIDRFFDNTNIAGKQTILFDSPYKSVESILKGGFAAQSRR